jgi:hypothetical protein
MQILAVLSDFFGMIAAIAALAGTYLQYRTIKKDKR